MRADATASAASQDARLQEHTEEQTMTAMVQPHRLTVGWAVRRALLGILILFVSIGGMAWLLHTSIDTTAHAQGGHAEGLLGTIANSVAQLM